MGGSGRNIISGALELSAVTVACRELYFGDKRHVCLAECRDGSDDIVSIPKIEHVAVKQWQAYLEKMLVSAQDLWCEAVLERSAVTNFRNVLKASSTGWKKLVRPDKKRFQDHKMYLGRETQQ